VTRLQGALAGHEAARLVAQTPLSEGRHAITQAIDGWDAAGLKAIASALLKESGVAATLLSPGDPIAMVVACSPDVGIDAGKILRTLLDRFGGRGGGRPDLAQGAGLVGGVDEILAAARELLLRAG
jgi:alanyl-tRNA synthetase